MNNINNLSKDDIDKLLSGGTYIPVYRRNELKARRNKLLKNENISNEEDFPSLLKVNSTGLKPDNPWASKDKNSIRNYKRVDQERNKKLQKMENEKKKYNKLQKKLEEENEERIRKEELDYDDDEYYTT